MSGVIDDQGQQWEHCNKCVVLKKFPSDLGYEAPTEGRPYGRMLCVKCVDAGIKDGSVLFDNITPAPDWKQVVVVAECEVNPSDDAFVKHVKEYAQDHYEKWGWDILVECCSDKEIFDATRSATTLRGAVTVAYRKLVKLHYEVRREIRAEIF